MYLAEDDRAEHLPYVRAGFAVVAYEIDGPIRNPDKATDAQIIAAAKAYKNSQAGLANAKMALDFAIDKIPSLDSDRIYTAGHSSAGTLALLVASHDQRIKGCAAFAPVTDVPKRIAAP